MAVIVKTEGIVFRSFKYRESSLIVDIYTQELGLRSYIVNGVRSAKSKTSGNILQAMSQLDLMVYDKNGAEKLNRISEFKLLKYYQKIPFDVIRSMIGQFMIEVLKKCLRNEDANPDLYGFAKDWLDFLDESKEKPVNLIPLFLVELASFMGFAFSFEKEDEQIFFDLQEGQFSKTLPVHRYYLDGELVEILFELVHHEKNSVHLMTISNRSRSELIDQLVLYYKLHIESFGDLRSLEILRSIIA